MTSKKKGLPHRPPAYQWATGKGYNPMTSGKAYKALILEAWNCEETGETLYRVDKRTARHIYNHGGVVWFMTDQFHPRDNWEDEIAIGYIPTDFNLPFEEWEESIRRSYSTKLNGYRSHYWTLPEFLKGLEISDNFITTSTALRKNPETVKQKEQDRLAIIADRALFKKQHSTGAIVDDIENPYWIETSNFKETEYLDDLYSRDPDLAFKYIELFGNPYSSDDFQFGEFNIDTDEDDFNPTDFNFAVAYR